MLLIAWNKWGYPVYQESDDTDWTKGKPAPDIRRDKTRAYRRHGHSHRRPQPQRFSAQSSAYRAPQHRQAFVGPQEAHS